MPKSLLNDRSLIPAFCLSGRQGTLFDSSDFKRKKNLILFFLSPLENEFLLKIEEAHILLKNHNAEIAVICPLSVSAIEDIYKRHRLSFAILCDEQRALLARFLKTESEETFGALFITNKIGELFFQYVVLHPCDLPPFKDIVQALTFIESQ